MRPRLKLLAGPPYTILGDRACVDLLAPRPGFLIHTVDFTDLVHIAGVVGTLVVLGRAYDLFAPHGGVVVSTRGVERDPLRFDDRRLRPVAYGDEVVSLHVNAGEPGAGADTAPAETRDTTGLVFRAPTSGRYYGRSSPDKPPFVTPGATITAGATVCLLEVMKTFNRVTYSGVDARVVQVLAAEGADVSAGDPLLALAALST